MEPSVATPAFHHLAGQTIWIDPGLPELQPFRTSLQAFPPAQLPAELACLPDQPALIQAEGWVADQVSKVSLWWHAQGYLIEIPAVGRFWTARDGSAIARVSRAPDADPAFLAEALLGPALVLALALKGTWCLHASAIAVENRVIVFLGVSGAGKSTLAAYLSVKPGVRRVADDILPVAVQDGRSYAFPHFPQLKLAIHQQPGLSLPEKLPLAVIYLLDEKPAPSVEAIGPGNSALLLAGHSVAARLFDRQLLSRHFDFCSLAGSILAVRKLAYPRVRSELPSVWQALQADLAGRDA
jgi:hypothetical protein